VKYIKASKIAREWLKSNRVIVARKGNRRRISTFSLEHSGFDFEVAGAVSDGSICGQKSTGGNSFLN
jgi:hypothetical protein